MHPSFQYLNEQNEGKMLDEVKNQNIPQPKIKMSDKLQLKLKLKPNNVNGVSGLQFSNPTSSFATRCDVIYKTLLRDCRRYFYDCFQMRKMRRNKRVYHLSKTLNNFVTENFSEHPKELRRELEFYLGCLVYPKEMTSAKVSIYDHNNKVIRGSERTQKVRKVKELHNILYRFSMDKCDKFFNNEYLAMIFKEYIKDFSERIEENKTLKANRDVYLAAVELIQPRLLQAINSA